MVYFSVQWTMKPDARKIDTALYASLTDEKLQAMYGSDVFSCRILCQLRSRVWRVHL